jgi:hypothetical protein
MVKHTQAANLCAAWVFIYDGDRSEVIVTRKVSMVTGLKTQSLGRLLLSINFTLGWLNMRGIIISNYALIREGLSSILSKYNNMKINLVTETLKETIKPIKQGEIDIVFLDLHENNKDELLLIKEMKECGVKSKFVILDFNNKRELFV